MEIPAMERTVSSLVRTELTTRTSVITSSCASTREDQSRQRMASARPSLIAWEARRLCRRRTVAGGHGNPLRVPMLLVRMRW